jgi:tetratricopeptide (TPR) repeat protein
MKDDRRMKRTTARPVIVMGLCGVIWSSQGIRAIAAAPRQLARPIDTTLCDPPPLGSSGPGDSYSTNRPPGYQIESSSPAVILFQRSSRSYEPAEQVEALHRAIALAPNYPKAYERRANLYQSQQNWPQAIADFDRAYQLMPEYPDHLGQQGLIYGKLQDWKKLIAIYQQLSRVDANNSPHYNTIIARAYGELKQWPQVTASYTAAIRWVELSEAGAVSSMDFSSISREVPEFITQSQSPLVWNKAELYLSRGYAYELQNQPKMARDDYDRAFQLAKSKNDWMIEDLYRSRCRLKVWAGDRPGGEADARVSAKELRTRQSMRRDPSDSYEVPIPPSGFSVSRTPLSQRALYRGLADLFGSAFETHTINRQSALNHFSQAIQADAKYVPAYYHRGIIRSQLQEHESAIADFDQAIALNPQFSLAHAARGEALRQLKRSDEAIATLDQALKLDPTLAAARLSQGMIWLERGDAKQAELAFNDVLTIDPESIEALTERSKIRRSRQDIVGATADDRRIKQVRDRWNLPL